MEGRTPDRFLVLLLFGAPNAPVRGGAGRALVLVRAAQASLPASLPRRRPPDRHGGALALDRHECRIQDATRDLTTTVKRRSAAAWDGLKKELDRVGSDCV